MIGERESYLRQVKQGLSFFISQNFGLLMIFQFFPIGVYINRNFKKPSNIQPNIRIRVRTRSITNHRRTDFFISQNSIF